MQASHAVVAQNPRDPGSDAFDDFQAFRPGDVETRRACRRVVDAIDPIRAEIRFKRA